MLRAPSPRELESRRVTVTPKVSRNATGSDRREREHVPKLKHLRTPSEEATQELLTAGEDQSIWVRASEPPREPPNRQRVFDKSELTSTGMPSVLRTLDGKHGTRLFLSFLHQVVGEQYVSLRHAHQKSRNRIFFGPARHGRATLHAAIAPHPSARRGVGKRRGLEKRSRRRPRRLPKWQQARLLEHATELMCSHPILELILDLQPNQSMAKHSWCLC